MIQKISQVHKTNTQFNLNSNLNNSSQNSKDKQEEKSKDKKNFDDFLTGAIYEKQEGDSVKVLKR